MEIFGLTDPRISGSGSILTVDETASLSNYLVDTTIGTRTADYTTTGTITGGQLTSTNDIDAVGSVTAGSGANELVMSGGGPVTSLVSDIALTIQTATGAIDLRAQGGAANVTTAGPLVVNSDITISSGTITSDTGALSFGNETLTTTGTINAADLFLTSPNVKLLDGVAGGGLAVEGQQANTQFRLQLHTIGANPPDGTDTVALDLYIKGTPANQDNLERISLQFVGGATPVAELLTVSTGSGTDRDFIFRAGNGNTNQLYLEASSGNVGIGTATLDYILDINAGEIGDDNYDGVRIVDTGWTRVSHPMLEFYNSHVDFNGSLARIYGEIGLLGENSKLYFAVADSSKSLQDRMVIDKGGNVGIGLTTVDDNYKLIVRRAANVNFGIGLIESELAIAAFNDVLSANIPMRFYASEFNLLNGSVGINTTTPDAKLQVVGDVHFGDDATNQTRFSTTGLQTMAGTARVMISIDLEPVLATRPSANPPFEGTEDSFSTHDFDDSTDESVFFHLELPHDYADAGTIHVHFDFFVDVAEAGATSVVWGVEYKKQAIGDIFSFTLGSETFGYTQTDVTPGTPGNDKKTHQSAEINLTTTGFVAGDYILLRLFRDANGTGGTDNFPRDARVIDYHIEYLSDKLGEST